jgi:cytochrome P450
MSWTWHLLGGAPGVEARLHAELDTVLNGRTPTVEDVPKLEWTRAVIAESMRLFPPAWTMGRRVFEQHTIDGHVIEPGSLVIMSQFVVHRDPRWWTQPEVFRPERWLTDGRRESGVGNREIERHKYAYFPFGGGVRLCIGESFAWTEAILLLATIAQQWQFTPADDGEPVPEPRITLRPKGLSMRAQRRG